MNDDDFLTWALLAALVAVFVVLALGVLALVLGFVSINPIILLT